MSERGMAVRSAAALIWLAVGGAGVGMGPAFAIQERPYLAQDGEVPSKVAVAPALNPDAGYKDSLRGLVPGSFDVLIHRDVTLPARVHVKPGIAWTSALEELAQEYRFSAHVDWDSQRVTLRPLEVAPRPDVPGGRSLAWVERTSGYPGGNPGALRSVQVGPEEYNTLSRPLENRARWVWAITAGEDGRDSLRRTLSAYAWEVKFAQGTPRLEARSDQRFEADSLKELLGRVLPKMGLTFDLHYQDRVVEVRLADTQ